MPQRMTGNIGENPTLYAEIRQAVAVCARARLDVTWSQLARLVKANRKSLERGSKINFDKFLILGRLAGLPDPYIAVLWARCSLPKEFAHLATYIGCTAPNPEYSKLKRKRKVTHVRADRRLAALLKQYVPDAYKTGEAHDELLCSRLETLPPTLRRAKPKVLSRPMHWRLRGYRQLRDGESVPETEGWSKDATPYDAPTPPRLFPPR